jgi:hypothetical protein
LFLLPFGRPIGHFFGVCEVALLTRLFAEPVVYRGETGLAGFTVPSFDENFLMDLDIVWSLLAW